MNSIKWYKNLSTRKGRLQSGCFVIEGNKSISQIAGKAPSQIHELLFFKDLPPDLSGFPARAISEKQLLSISNTKTPQGIIAIVHLPQGVYTDTLPKDIGNRILVLEDIQDPGNVGTLIRTAAAFDYSGIILSGKCADPFSPKCTQSTAGTVFSLWIRKSESYIEMCQSLKQDGFNLVVTHVKGQDTPSSLRSRDRLVLALGNESSGPSEILQDLADQQLRIPINQDNIDSLNVAICGAICMYLSSRKH